MVSILVIACLPIGALAAGDESWVAKIEYQVNGVNKTLEITESVGQVTDDYGDSGTVYYAQLEKDSIIDSMIWNEEIMLDKDLRFISFEEYNVKGENQLNTYGEFESGSVFKSPEDYLTDDEFNSYTHRFDANVNGFYEISGEELQSLIKTSGVKGFVTVLTTSDNTNYALYCVYVQISTEEPSTDPPLPSARGGGQTRRHGDGARGITNNPGFAGLETTITYDSDALELKDLTRVAGPDGFTPNVSKNFLMLDAMDNYYGGRHPVQRGVHREGQRRCRDL